MTTLLKTGGRASVTRGQSIAAANAHRSTVRIVGNVAGQPLQDHPEWTTSPTARKSFWPGA